jgi:serine/threonine protein kinase
MFSANEANSLANLLIKNSDEVELLGAGGFGEVYKIDDIVIKKLNLASSIDEFKNEIIIWEEFVSIPEFEPFMPKYYGSLLKKSNKQPYPEYKNSYNNNESEREKYNKKLNAWWFDRKNPDYYGFIFQKYESVIDMHEFLSNFNSYNKYSFESGYALFNNIIKAFKILHTNGYIHRDIKPSNILIRTSGDKTVPIIIDFGMVCKLPCSSENRCLSDEYSPNGTPYYLPRNMISKNERNELPNPIFPVTKKKPGFFNTLKNSVLCRRRTMKKGPNSVIVTTKNIKLKGVFNVATDNYAIALTLEDLIKVINWKGHSEEKHKAIEAIAKLKSSILPFLVAEEAAKRTNRNSFN